jgi:DNA polymerase alpha subunit B
MTITFQQEVFNKFGPSADNPEVIQSLEQITKVFSMSVEDVYINWESFAITKHDGVKLEYTTENLLQLQTYIQEKLEKKRDRNTAPSTIRSRKIVNFGSSSPFTTPLLKKKKLDSPRTLVSPSENRIQPKHDTPDESSASNTPSKTTESFQIIESLNKSLPDIHFDELSNPVKIIANFEPKKYSFRTMRQKLLETADVLDEQIDSFAQIVQSHYGFQPSDLTNPSIISQNEIIAVGRIVPDNPQYRDTDTLNEQSLALECSRLGGIGKRVPLDLTSLTKFALFPGQIVCVKGKNPSGEVFKVSEVVELPYLGAPITPGDELKQYKDVKLNVISGPYTGMNDLDFAPLEELVQRINNEYKPHVVIMFGPFVDITHPLISQGVDLEVQQDDKKVKPQTLDGVFKVIVSPILKKINPLTQVVLIPSLKDAVSKHAAYPQDSFDRKQLQLGKNFKCFTNPSMFQVNEINIGVSNNDIFRDLKDVSKGDLAMENRFERISNHVIEQRRFYPLFPGVTKTKKTKVNGEDFEEILPGSNLDIPFLGLTEFNDIIPDILIIPSELRFFAKIVKNVLIINPGSLMKFNSRGSIVNISIKEPDLDQLTRVEGEDEMYLHDIWKRARVDIIKA